MDELTAAARKRELSACKATLVGCDETLGLSAWDWGAALASVEKLELWREDGAASFTAWLESEIAISRRAAQRAIELSRHFTREMAGRFGGRKLTAALTWLELTAKNEKPGDVLAADLRIRGAKGTFISVSFVDASARQVEAACDILREAAATRAEKAAAREIPAEVRAEAQVLEKALPAAPPKTVRGARVELVRGSDGATAVTVRGLPYETFKAFSAWLATQPPT